MADEKAAPAETATAKSAGPAPMVLIAAVVGALVAGAATGNFVLAPRIAAKTTAQPAAHGEATKKSDKKGGGGHGDSRSAVHKIENLIVNPAGSEGTRFLMTTVAIEVHDEKVGASLRDHDAQVRDVVIATLEGQTLEMLTRPGARAELKKKIAQAVATALNEDVGGLEVFLPQFVIQ
jgi:flagellar FliL protein